MSCRFPDLPRQEQLERPPLAEDPAAAVRVQRARHQAMLEEIAEMAMDLSRMAYRRAKAEAAAEPVAQAGDDGDGAATVCDTSDAEARDEAPVAARIDALRGALVEAGGGGEAGAGAAILRSDPSLVFARLSGVLFRALALSGRLAEERKAAAEADGAAAHPDWVMTPERKAKIMARWELLLSRKNLVVDIVKQAIKTSKPHTNAEVAARALNDKLLEFERFEVLNDTIRTTAQRWCDKLGVVLDWSLWAKEPWAIKEEDGKPEWMEYRGGAPP